MQYKVTQKIANDNGTFVTLQSTNTTTPELIEILSIQLTKVQESQINYGDTVSLIISKS